jgi:thiol-disulfide isomerase/thioredoxin
MIRITARRSALVAASVAAALLLAACSSGDGISAIETPAERDAASNAASSAGKTTKPTQTPKATQKSSKAQAKAPQLAANAFVPSVDVLDVRSGDRLDLQSVVPSDRPVLLWAWAPHCPSCRREAPALERFAAENQDAIKVVGIGTQDDQAYAEEFLSTTGVNTPQMLWDPSFESWRVMGITAQPTWVLVRGDGSLITGWVGGFPEQQILSAIQSA